MVEIGSVQEGEADRRQRRNPTPAMPKRRNVDDLHSGIGTKPFHATRAALRPPPNCLLRELCGTLFGLPPLETAFCRDFGAELQGLSPLLPPSPCLSIFQLNFVPAASTETGLLALLTERFNGQEQYSNFDLC